MSYLFNLTIQPQSLEKFSRELQHRLEPARQAAQNAMADMFYQVVEANFGVSGLDRPSEWDGLSAAYARKVGREAATLYVTGALAAAVKVNYGEGESTVSVSKSDIPYAMVHQYGYAKGGIPARPYFPIDANGRITDYTQESVKDIARIQFAKEMR